MILTLSVLTRIFSNSVANLYQKKASESDSSVSVNLFAYLLMSAICVIPAFFVDWLQFSKEFWITVFMAGILCTVGTIALIEALKIGEISTLAPINSYKSVIGLVSAFLLLGEVPEGKELLCIFFMVFGNYIVLNDGSCEVGLKNFFRKDILLRFFALICSGIEASLLKKIIIMSNFKISLILWCFCGFLCSLIIFVFRENKRMITKKNVGNCAIIGITLLLMQLTTNFVFSKMDVGAALALFQLSALVSLFFGYKVYHETGMMRKLTGTVIMVASAMFILVGG